MQAVTNAGRISVPTAQLAIGAAIAVILFLASLHVLSPNFDPRWRVVSEYSNGNYGWVLSLMFATGALSDWALGFAVWAQVHDKSGRTGLILLIISGIGGAMASAFPLVACSHLEAVYTPLERTSVALVYRLALACSQAWPLTSGQFLPLNASNRK